MNSLTSPLSPTHSTTFNFNIDFTANPTTATRRKPSTSASGSASGAAAAPAAQRNGDDGVACWHIVVGGVAVIVIVFFLAFHNPRLSLQVNLQQTWEVREIQDLPALGCE